MNKTFTSEDARNKMRDLLDAVVAGQEVIIERHSKPVGVIIPHKRWLAWKQQRKSELDQIRADMDAGNSFTQEQVDAGLRTQGLEGAEQSSLAWDEFQEQFHAALVEAGYDTREKIVELVREVRREKAIEAGRRPKPFIAEVIN